MAKHGKSKPEPTALAETARAPAKRNSLILAAFLLIVFALHCVTIRPGLDWGDDFAIYLSHTLNLTRGLPYANTGYVVNPYFTSYAPQAYPPGLPLLLAPLMMVFPVAESMPDLYPYKLFITLCLIASLWLIDRVIRDELSIAPRIAVLGAVALSAYVLGFKNAIASDIPYIAASFGAILLADRALAPGLAQNQQMLRAALAACAMLFAAQIRSIGIVLPAAFVLSQVWQHRRITRPAIVVLSICASSSAAFSWLKVSSDSYFAVLGVYFTSFADVVSGQIQYIPKFHGHALMLLWKNRWVDFVPEIMLALCVPLAMGGLLLRIKHTRAIDFYVLIYYGVLLIYPAPQDYRLLLPIMPMFFFYIAVALKRLIDTRLRPLGAALTLVIVGVTAACYTGNFFDVPRRPAPTDLTAPDAQQALDFIREKTQPGDLILCSKPRAVALFTSRPATPMAWSEDKEFGWLQLRELRPRYFFLGRQFDDNRDVFLLWARHHRSIFTLVFQNDQYAIFSIDPLVLMQEHEPPN